MLGTGVAGVSVGGGAEGGTVECVGWGVGVGRFDAVGFRMFPFWFSDCCGVGCPRSASGSLVDGMFDGNRDEERDRMFWSRGGLGSLKLSLVLLLSGVGSVASRAVRW